MPHDPPAHMSAEEFRRHGHALIDWIADYHAGVEQRPVASRVEPGEVYHSLPAHPPDGPEPFERMLADVERLIMPGITHWQSPRFFAYFPSNVSGPSILGELLSAGLGVQGMLWATSPACTELEMRVLDWLAGMLGLPEAFHSTSSGGGVIQDTASSAVLGALVAARERASGGATNRRGGAARLGLYCTAEAHSSVEKAARIAGVGSDAIRRIDVDGTRAMDPAALDRAIVSDVDSGVAPMMVSATVGTTSSGAVDPVAAIGPVCNRHGVWLHVDAAWAGTAALCPEHRALHAGLEHADSYCFNPHKWMLTNFDCTCFWVRDRAALTGALSITPEYLRTRHSDAGAVTDYRDWHVQLGRRFRALKLWFVIRHYGVQGLQAHVRHHVELARWFAGQIRASAHLELAAPPSLSLICFRHREGAQRTAAMLEALNSSGRLYISHTRLDDQLALRFCIGQTHTTRRHVEEAWSEIAACADIEKAGPHRDPKDGTQ